MGVDDSTEHETVQAVINSLAKDNELQAEIALRACGFSVDKNPDMVDVVENVLSVLESQAVKVDMKKGIRDIPVLTSRTGDIATAMTAGMSIPFDFAVRNGVYEQGQIVRTAIGKAQITQEDRAGRHLSALIAGYVLNCALRRGTSSANDNDYRNGLGVLFDKICESFPRFPKTDVVDIFSKTCDLLDSAVFARTDAVGNNVRILANFSRQRIDEKTRVSTYTGAHWD